MKTVSQRIAKELNYFIAHPSKRCITPNGNMCVYDGSTLGLKTKGCLIGRMLPKDLRSAVDKIYPQGIGVMGLLEHDTIGRLKDRSGKSLPQWMIAQGGVLNEFQSLHDTSKYWDEGGLSRMGEQRLETLIIKHKLNKEDFKLDRDA